MDNELKIKMYSFTVDCTEPHKLAKLNPSYEERSDIFFEIWEQYRMFFNFEIREKK